jgi:hypothetical protein
LSRSAVSESASMKAETWVFVNRVGVWFDFASYIR